ncbi:MAG: Nif3-like dinuclear metal center hexameric protein [Bacillota bacterium]|nr:Nif3-like dinuclear metal center hexameric protein [Bacillota bacterium]
MVLKVKDIMRIIEEFAPAYLKEDYDNVGLMVGNSEDEVKSILVSLDCTLETIKEAEEKECNLILTHHPLLFIKPKNITTDSLQGRKIIELIRNNINLYSSHTNLDMTLGGVNDIITEILGYDNWKIIEPSNSNENKSENVGIGRIVTLDKPILLSSICEKIKEKLEIQFLRYSGNDNLQIKKIAIINGSGQDYFSKAEKLGADCIITGDTTYHRVSDLSETGIAVIDAGHFETEWPAVKKLGIKLENKIRNLGFTNEIIISNVCKSPYKIYYPR